MAICLTLTVEVLKMAPTHRICTLVLWFLFNPSYIPLPPQRSPRRMAWEGTPCELAGAQQASQPRRGEAVDRREL
jgi:hypothetical protein